MACKGAFQAIVLNWGIPCWAAVRTCMGRHVQWLAHLRGFVCSFPEEKRLAAVEAIAALDLIATDVPMALPAEVDPSADAVAALTRASSYPRRKRAPPA